MLEKIILFSLTRGARWRFVRTKPSKDPIITSLGLALLADVSIVTPALGSLNIDYVSVGNAGNAADTTGYGKVDYAYNIGKYEVTNAQYVNFLNAKAQTDTYSLYNTITSIFNDGIGRTGASGSYIYSATSGFENMPVLFVCGERRHPGGRIWHPAKSSSGEDADFRSQACTKSLRQDAGDSRQDGGAPHRRRRSIF